MHRVNAAAKSSCTLLVAAVLLLASGLGSVSRSAGFGGFIENRGQMDGAVRYYALGARAAVYFTPGALVVNLKDRGAGAARPGVGRNRLTHAAGPERTARRGCALYVRFEGANPSPGIEGRARKATCYNYILGSDPSTWRSDVPAFGEVVYHDLWPGVDLVYREENGGLTYQIISSPGANVGAVRFGYEGADQVVAEEDGSYVIRTSIGPVVDVRSVPGKRTGSLIPLRGTPEETDAPARDRDNPSSLVWSTFLGGSEEDCAYALALDDSGNAVVTGTTESSDFPTTAGAYDQSFNSYDDVFVAKISAPGSTLVWSTFLGGSYYDYGHGLVLDDSGNVVVTGGTWSSDFPTTAGAYDRSHNDGIDVFVAKVSSTGSALLWSTFLGGNDDECSYAVALDSLRNAAVAGYTTSSDFPTTPGAYDESFNDSSDVFVAKVSSTGSALLWSTFLGGSGDEDGSDLALDPSGDAAVTGTTSSPDFPTTPGAYSRSFNGGSYDAFVAKLSSTGSTLLGSTYLGGTDRDEGRALATDPLGNEVVTGNTWSSDFPTTPGAYDRSHNGWADVFVAKVSPTASALLGSTLLGGSGTDLSEDLALSSSGEVSVTGETGSSDFPTTPGAYDQSPNGEGWDIFVARLLADSALVWGSYLGGWDYDFGYALALADSADVLVAGNTMSSNFPTTPGAHDRVFQGYDEGIVAKMRLAVETGVAGRAAAPRLAGLLRAVPNPFRHGTMIRWSLVRGAHVDLAVFDVTGRRVATLARGFMPAGDHVVSWDGRDDCGERVASGVYFVGCEAGGRTYSGTVARVW